MHLQKRTANAERSVVTWRIVCGKLKTAGRAETNGGSPPPPRRRKLIFSQLSFLISTLLVVYYSLSVWFLFALTFFIVWPLSSFFTFFVFVYIHMYNILIFRF